MTTPTFDQSVGRYAYEEVTGYERSRVATLAALALAAMALLVNVANLVAWVGAAGLVASEQRYRRVAYGLLGGTTAKRVTAVTFHSGGHLVLVLVVGLSSLGAIVLGTLP
ncbi:MAG: hypothetical protein IPI32_12085 [Austwickia sp.]|nr:hypothetical protein [Austwickia sp.]